MGSLGKRCGIYATFLPARDQIPCSMCSKASLRQILFRPGTNGGHELPIVRCVNFLNISAGEHRAYLSSLREDVDRC